MALKKSSLSLESSESDEELPTFAFLKREPSSTNRQPEREEKIVVDTSDSDASYPPSLVERLVKDSLPILNTAETVTQTEPGRVVSSQSKDAVVYIPLAERPTYKFLTHKLFKPRPSQTATKKIVDNNNNNDNGASGEWKKDSFPKVPDIPLHDTPERSTSDNKDPILDKLPSASACPVQTNSLIITKTNSDALPSQKKTKHSQQVQGRDLQRCWQQEQASQKESTLRPERRASLVNRLKSQRPEECLKHIIVVLDPVLLLQMEVKGGQLLGALQSMGCCRVIEAQVVPCSITWRRRTGPSEDKEDPVEEQMVLVLLLVEVFVSMIYNLKQGSDNPEKGKETLQGFVTDVTATAGNALSLVIVDQEKCFSPQNPPRRKKQGVANKQAKEKQQLRQPKANVGSMVSRVHMEEALVDLQLHTEAQVKIVQSWKELAHSACSFTKAVAEAPFKKKKKLRDETSFSCVESDWAGGVKVDRSGRGLTLVWRRQIEQLNGVSLEMAGVIVDVYSSPQLLVQASQQCLSDQEYKCASGEGVTSTSCRVGPELSRCIYLQMSTIQPELCIKSVA
uniref:Structure-specific endonuclease subunit EME1 n=1 Tax=Otolemur garnettii TaxID=30611 RepID=H0XLQ7_OTOGA